MTRRNSRIVKDADGMALGPEERPRCGKARRRDMWPNLSAALHGLAKRPFVVCVGWALWLSMLYGVFGPHSYVRIHDNANSHLAQSLDFSLFRGPGVFASWADSWVCGVDRRPILHGLDRLPFLLFPGWLAYWALMFAQRLLAAYFGFRLVHDRWKVDRWGCWFFALSYSAFLQPSINESWAGWTVYDGFTLAAVPAVTWVLLATDSSLRRLSLLAAGAGVVYAWTSDYPHAAFMMVLLPLVLFASTAGKDRSSRGRAWVALAVFVAAWAVGSLPAVLAGLMDASTSHRADRTAFSPLSLLFPAQALLALRLLRDNLIGFALGVWAAFSFRDRRTVVTVVGIAGAALAVAFANWGQAALDAYGGPLRHFTLLRFYLLLPFLACAAGAFGIDSLATSPRRALRCVGAAAIVILLLSSVRVNALMAREMVRGSNYAVLYDDPALVLLQARAREASPFRVATVVSSLQGDFVQEPAFAWGRNIDTVDGYLTIYPQRYQDFWERVITPLIANDTDVYNRFHYWGNQVYLFGPAKGFAPGPVRVGDYYDLDLLALANVRYLISKVELRDQRLREASQPGRQSTDRRTLTLLTQWLSQLTGGGVASSLYLYEVQGVLPRAFVVSSVRSFPTRKALLDALASASLAELATTAFVEEAEDPKPERFGGAGRAGPVKSAGDRLEISAEASAPVFLVVSEQYSRFWRAEVDGSPVGVVPADGPFMGVHIPTGRHAIVMRYQPPYALPLAP